MPHAKISARNGKVHFFVTPGLNAKIFCTLGNRQEPQPGFKIRIFWYSAPLHVNFWTQRVLYFIFFKKLPKNPIITNLWPFWFLLSNYFQKFHEKPQKIEIFWNFRSTAPNFFAKTAQPLRQPNRIITAKSAAIIRPTEKYKYILSGDNSGSRIIDCKLLRS